MSVKDRLGFSTKPAAPVEKVSSHSVKKRFIIFQFSYLVALFPFSGVLNFHGPHKDGVQSYSSESSPEDLGGGPEEETGVTWIKTVDRK